MSNATPTIENEMSTREKEYYARKGIGICDCNLPEGSHLHIATVEHVRCSCHDTDLHHGYREAAWSVRLRRNLGTASPTGEEAPGG